MIDVATRAALAAANTSSSPALLTEAGREGFFVWNGADLSNEVTADGLQGIYVAPSSDTTGASGAWGRVHRDEANPEWFGFSTSVGEQANVTAINTAIETCLDLGIRHMKVPAKTYPLGYGSEFPANSTDIGFGVDGGAAYAAWTGLKIGSGPSALDLTGAKLIGYHARITIGEYATYVTVRGGHIVCTIGTYQGTTSSNGTLLSSSNLRSTYLFNFYGHDIDIEGTSFEKDDPLAGGYMGYIRAQTQRVRMSNYKFRGGNGHFISGNGHRFTAFDLESDASFGDDCFALKAGEANPSQGAVVTKDIIIGHGRVKNYAAVIAIGSEVGRPGSIGNDPDFSNRVQNVLVHDVIGEALLYAALIKPGSISAINYRDGVIEDVEIRNIILNDPAGVRFRKAIYFVASRGMIVRRVACKGIKVNARAYDSGASGATCGAVHFWHLNYTGDTQWSSGTTPEGAASGEPTFQDIRVEVEYNDPYDGADYGAAGTLGYPVQSIVRAELQTTTYGIMERIEVEVRANGCKERGIFVREGLDDAITLRSVDFRNICRNPTSSVAIRGGVVASSDIAIGHLSISNLGSGYPVGGTDSATYGPTAYKSTQRAYIQLGSFAQIATPGAPTATPNTTGGTLAAATYSYRVSALNAQGETLASVAASATTTTATSSVTVTPAAVAGATSYRIYGRTAGSELLMVTLNTGGSWTDTGSATPSGARPASNTSGNADKTVWSACKPSYIHKVEWIDANGVTVNATNYTTLKLVNRSTAGSIVTTATNSTALTADTPTVGHAESSIRMVDALNISAGTGIGFTKTDTGTGATVTDLVAIIHYIEHGN